LVVEAVAEEEAVAVAISSRRTTGRTANLKKAVIV